MAQTFDTVTHQNNLQESNGKAVLDVEAYRGQQSAAPLILNLGMRRKCLISFTTRYPLNRRLERIESPSGYLVEERTPLSMPRTEPQIVRRCYIHYRTVFIVHSVCTDS
jgi:hypothetical protein